jgi:hypothetical protein
MMLDTIGDRPAGDQQTGAGANEVNGGAAGKAPGVGENVVFPFAGSEDNAAAARAAEPSVSGQGDAAAAVPAKAASAQDVDTAKPALQLQSAVAAKIIKSDALVDRGSLETLVDNALERARELLKYYPGNAREMGKISRRLRRAAVILGVLGGLCPLLPAGLINELPDDLKAMISPLGFVLFALAAGAILLDQAFGYSSSWMRSRLTETELSKLIWSFEIEVRGALSCAADKLSGDDVNVILGRVSQFAAACQDTIVRETQTWIAENKAGLLQIEQISRSSSRPGGADQGGSRLA